MARFRLIPLLAALCAVTASACGGSTTSATVKTGAKPVAAAHRQWKVYAPQGSGYRVEIPTGWSTIDAATLASSGAIRDLEARNPGLKSGFRLFTQMAAQPGVLVAMDLTPAGRRVVRRTGFAPNIIVRRIPIPSGSSDADILRAVLARGRANAAALPTAIGRPSVTPITFAGSPGGVITYRLHETTGVGVASVTESDYVTVVQGTAYTIYCTTVAGDVSRVHPACMHALDSFAIAG